MREVRQAVVAVVAVVVAAVVVVVPSRRRDMPVSMVYTLESASTTRRLLT